MTITDPQRNLLEKICWCYYCEELTQEQIAKKFSISRLKVVSLLQEARKLNVVSFHINKSNSSRSQLECFLIEKYKLKDAYIIPTANENLNASLGKAVAAYINPRLSPKSIINIGYGNTLSYFINELASSASFAIEALSLTGGVNCYLPNGTSNIFDLKLHLHPAPLVLSSKQLRDELMKHNDICWINKMTKTASFSIFSLGGMNTSATVIENGSFDINDFKYLQKLNSVGDILGHFVDANANIVDQDLDQRLITTSLDEIKNLPNTVVVAGGKNKIDIILASLKFGFIDILITDEQTALTLQNKSGRAHG